MVNNLPQGNYVVKVDAGQNVYREKVVVLSAR
jgi:hypothetical protein